MHRHMRALTSVLAVGVTTLIVSAGTAAPVATPDAGGFKGMGVAPQGGFKGMG